MSEPQQVFLSYCHRDDEPYGPQNRRWVEEFEVALRASIGQRIGPGRVAIWRDKRRLAGNELFDGQIESQIRRSDIFVSVLSQHYLASAYCKKEFLAFGNSRIASGDLHVNHLSRIVKVYRRAIDRADMRRFVGDEALVPEVDGTVGFELFHKDDNGVDRDVLLDAGHNGLYWQRADDIAHAIKRILDVSPGWAPTRISPAAASTAISTIYLATTASDMREQRDAIQRELEDRGHHVLPTRALPEDAEDFERAVETELATADLSVHLFGSRYGSIPDGARQSGVIIQAERAMTSAFPNLRSIFWAPSTPGAAPTPDERIGQFVQDLEQRVFDSRRIEFVRASSDELRSLIFDRLRHPASTQAQSINNESTTHTTSIYLICDPGDRTDARPLANSLVEQGFDVELSSIEGTVDELVEENRANLVRCDSVVILWGRTREAWVRSKLRDIQQAPVWGRQRPFRGRFIVMSGPDSAAKSEFIAPNGVVLMREHDPIAALRRLLSS